MTELMVNDDLAINRINPYTATNTFGVSHDGAYKGPNTLTWSVPGDEPAQWDIADQPEFLQHFTPGALDKAGAKYTKGGMLHPADTFLYPARKFQYDDGTTSWSREVSFRDGSNYMNEGPFAPKDSLFPIWILLVILIVLLFLLKS